MYIAYPGADYVTRVWLNELNSFCVDVTFFFGTKKKQKTILSNIHG